MFEIRRLKGEDRAWTVPLLREYWGSSMVVTRGRIYDASQLPGFAAIDGDRPVGLVVFRIHDNECEVISLNSLREGIGIGSALLKSVFEFARSENCRRVWLITTNDNTPAIRFYQMRGMRLAAVYAGALDESRKLKPEIPHAGIDGIPLRDEIELEFPIE